MSRDQLNDFRETLEGMLGELLTRPADADGITVERASDPMDTLQRRGELDVTVHAFTAAYRRAQEIRSAIQRMEEGEYGVCEECGEGIGRKRLEAAPWTSLCRDCKEASETEMVAA